MWHYIGPIRVDKQLKELWVSSWALREHPYTDAVKRLSELIGMSYRDIARLIRSKGAVPRVREFNKFGLMMQAISVEFGEEVARILEHYVELRKP